MVDYVEDPIGRIVNVHWADDDGGHPPDEPVLQCGTYSYSFLLDFISSGIVSPIPTGSDGDPWMVRDPSSPDWQHTWPLGLTLTTGGILFGRGQTRVQMTPASYTISTSFWDLTNTAGSDRTYGLLLIHSAGPRDYNQFPYLGIPTSPQPYEPFFTFTGGSLSWTYQINPGLNGEIWKPTFTGSGANDILWDDPSRFDPAFGGDALIRVVWRVGDDPEGLWRDADVDAFWRGSTLGPENTPAHIEWGDPPVFYPGSSAYGQQIGFEISSICPDLPYRHEDPVSIHDDGSQGNLGGGG